MIQNPRRIGLRSKEEYKDEKIVAKYTSTIDAMFKIIAEKEGHSTAATTSLAEAVVELEKKLSAITMDEEDANDPLVSVELSQKRALLAGGHLLTECGN